MAQRIVVFGATGYTGRLTAERLVAQGERPVLAARSEPRVRELAERLGGLEWVLADVGKPHTVFDLVGAGDVLVSTVGPFMKWGQPAVRAAISAGARYLDSTGEPAFIRSVFEELGPAAERSGAALMTAMGYDFVPGALAGALAVQEGGDTVVRVDVGYYALGAGAGSASGGTRASLVGVALNEHHAYRDSRIQPVRVAERVRNFPVKGRLRPAFSLGGAEHFSLPAVHPSLREVNVYLGWFGPLTRPLQAASLLMAPAARVPNVRGLLARGGERLMGMASGPAPGTTPGGISWIPAIAYDHAGRQVAEVHLSGVDWYAFTANFLAWAAAQPVEGAGALGPVEAFGLERLERGCAEAGLERVEAPAA
jgi:NAD(P)-dependent dehydrogenase (short-subunit alcohol dehydrogenase family)